MRVFLKGGNVHITLSIKESIKLYDQLEDQLSDTSKQPIQRLYDSVRQIADSAEEETEIPERPHVVK